MTPANDQPTTAQLTHAAAVQSLAADLVAGKLTAAELAERVRALEPGAGTFADGLEAAAKVADDAVQVVRGHISACRAWSPAQAEWSRARDLGLDIAEAIRALTAPVQP